MQENLINTFPHDDFIEVQTWGTDGRLNRHTWVIDWEDLVDHTPFDTKDLRTMSEEQISSMVFPEGVRGFFTIDNEHPWAP